MLAIGSFVRGSAIRHYSDLDLLLVLTIREVRWGNSYKSSYTVLNEVRAQLQSRYQRTEVGRDGQAVVIEFADGAHPVDVVPGFFSRVTNKIPVYWIPDGGGEWIETSPMTHNRYIRIEDTRSAGKLKNVAKVIKLWRVCRSPEIPLNSFHLELLLAAVGTCLGVKSYSQCLFDTLRLIDARDCRALQDPLGISGLVKAANTESKLERLRTSVANSYAHGVRAIVAEEEGDTQEAVRQWDIVFNGNFPPL